MQSNNQSAGREIHIETGAIRNVAMEEAPDQNANPGPLSPVEEKEEEETSLT